MGMAEDIVSLIPRRWIVSVYIYVSPKKIRQESLEVYD
jgi:hypothetical protein